MPAAGAKIAGLEGASWQKVFSDARAEHKSESIDSRDYAAIADAPLRWLLLGLDSITADFAPPPPNLAAEKALVPSQPSKSKKDSKSTKRQQELPTATRPALPPDGTPKCTAARLLICLQIISRKQQHARVQLQLQSLVQQMRPAACPRISSPERVKAEGRKVRPHTPDVLQATSEKNIVLQPWHSQAWRRRELRDQILDENAKAEHSAAAGAIVQPLSLQFSASSASDAGISSPKSSWAREARKTVVKRDKSDPSLPPLKDRKFERGTPALGAGFRVLSGFRSQSVGTDSAKRTAPSFSQSRLLTGEDAVFLMRESGYWPRASAALSTSAKVAKSQSAGSLPKSAGSLPALQSRSHFNKLPTEDSLMLPTENSLTFAQAPTEFGTDLGEPSDEFDRLAEELSLLEQDEELIPDMGKDSFTTSSAHGIDPLKVFPQLAKRQPLPARRIFFTDPDSKDLAEQEIREPVGDYDVYEPQPSCTPSSVESGQLTPYHLLMASSMRGSLLGSSMRRPPETSTELVKTLSLATLGLEDNLNESSDEEEAAFRHPPRWTRKQAILNSSGAHDFGSLAPSRFPTTEADTRSVLSTPQWAFMSSCSKTGALPTVPRPIVKILAGRAQTAGPAISTNSPATIAADAGDSPKSPAAVHMDMSNRNLGDSGLKALGITFPMLGCVETLSFAGANVSCKAMRSFLKAVSAQAASLKQLNLSRNRLGEGTMTELTSMLENGRLGMLQSLSLCSVDIPVKVFAPLIETLTAVRTLALADTHMGFRENGRQPSVEALAKLISEGVLTSLDISGNFVRREGAEALARSLESTKSLTALDFSYNAGGSEKKIAGAESLSDSPPFGPVLLICESLLRNRSLKRLSLSHCSLDYPADFILSEALLRHPCLSELDLSSNPHGVLGLSSLIRAVAATRILRVLDLTDVRSDDLSSVPVKYNFRDPTGEYVLHLSHPQHRSVLRTLLDRPALEGKDTKACFQNVSANVWSLASASPDARGIYEVPSDGVLRFTYNVPSPSTPRGDNHPLAKAQDWHRRGLRHVSFERCLVLAAAFGTCHSSEQMALFLEGVCNCLLLKRSHVRLFLEHAPATHFMGIVHRLAPSVGDQGEMLELAQLLTTPEERARIRADLRNLALLNLRSPTGHYKLRLGSSCTCDIITAERLQALAAFEATVACASGRPDVSQQGNFEPIRNIYHHGRNLHATSFAGVELPHEGLLEFDYATFVKMHKGTTKMPTDVLVRICAAVQHSKAPWMAALKAFRTVVDRFSMALEDVQALTDNFVALAKTQEKEKPERKGSKRRSKLQGPSVRVEMLIACFGRLSELTALASKEHIYDAELFTPEECLELRTRLGSALMFDWGNCHDAGSNFPTGNNYELDLSVHEERLVATYLLRVAEKEGEECLKNPEWTGAEESLDSQWFARWLADFPTTGIFKVTYTEEEDKHLDICDLSNPRRDIAQKLLGFDLPPSVKQPSPRP